MLLKQLLYRGLTLAPLLSLLRRRRPVLGAHVLMYHEIAADDVDIDAWTVLRRSDFLRQIEHVRRHYEIVGLGTALARMSTGFTTSKPMAVVTFDDGDRGNVESLLPLVEREQIPVTIYIATRHVVDGNLYWFDRLVNALQTSVPVHLDLRAQGLRAYRINRVHGKKNWVQISHLLEDMKTIAPPEREALVESVLEQLRRYQRREAFVIAPASVEQVKQLSRSPWVTLGAHSHCHNILTQLDRAAVEASVTQSKALLEQWTGQTIEHFAYPNGSYNALVTDVVRQAGFRSAVTTVLGSWEREDSIFAIPRVGIGRYDSLEQFKINLLGGVNRFFPWRSQKQVSSAVY